MKRILLARHGECDMNLHLSTTIGGQSNASPLTPLGVRQAEDLGAYLATLQRTTNAPVVGAVHASTAVRARDTARLVLRALDIPEERLQLSDRLLELDQGEWEGASRAAIYTPEQQAIISRDPLHFRPPGGESPHDVETRMLGYLTGTVLPQCADGGPPALVVGHGFAFKTVLRALLSASPSMTRNVHLDNTGLIELACRPAGVPDSRGRVTDKDAWYILRCEDVVVVEVWLWSS